MKLLRLPDLLLLIVQALTFGFGFRGDKIVDIQLHDTYFVFGSFAGGFSHFHALVILVLALTWLGHQLCRRYHLLAKGWRWFQIGVTVLSVLSILIVLCMGFPRLGYENWEMWDFLSQMLALSTCVFFLSQLLFWAIVIITFIVHVIRARFLAQ